MDELTLRKLAAAAEHETNVAEQAADAVTRCQVKLDRARAAVTATEDALDALEQQAAEALDRAEAAVTAHREAADGLDASANAGVAKGSGKA